MEFANRMLTGSSSTTSISFLSSIVLIDRQPHPDGIDLKKPSKTKSDVIAPNCVRATFSACHSDSASGVGHGDADGSVLSFKQVEPYLSTVRERIQPRSKVGNAALVSTCSR